ncbi:MAG: DUF3857 domain-containing protein [Aquaticitalea sp.]
MNKLLLLLLLILSTKSFSQNDFNSEDLTVTKADLNIKTYKKDSTANALMIYEYGKSYVDKKSYKLVTEVKQKLKILNRKGFDKSNIEIHLYNDGSTKEKISNITATTFNIENNSVSRTQLEKSQIYEEKYNDNYTIVKFTFPNIKEGSVISYSYTLETPYMFKYRPWYFQSDIPTLYSQYEASIPGNYEYNIKLVGFLKLETEESVIEKNCLDGGRGTFANCSNYNYVMKDIPAFNEEEYMTSSNNYLARIEYELKTFRGFDGIVKNYTKTWKTVDSELKNDKDIGRQLNKSSVAKGLLDGLIVNEKDPLTKAKAIYKYIQDTYVWNGKYDIFKEVSIKNLIDNKSGKVSEINILLHNLLDEYGIEVFPVLLSTRNNGFATKIFPILTDFNYMIVQAKIDGKTYLLDATEKYASFGELPFRCLNQYGRLLDFDTGSYWIDINAAIPSFIHYKVELYLTSEAELQGKITKKATGYHALPLKQAYFENKKDYLKSRMDKYPNIDFLEYKVLTEDRTDFEFNEVFEVKQDAEITGNNIYLNPFLFKFFTENLFKLQERTYPIDFGYKDSFLYTIKIVLDKSYEVLEYPKDLTLKLPNNSGALLLTSKIEGNTIQLYFKITFNEPIYNPEFYDYIKKFMGTVVDTQNNALMVIQKK